jgi:Ca2+-binding EF-hand superfamily protein
MKQMNEQLDPKVINEMPKIYKIELNVNDLNIVLSGLQELPFKISNQTINNIVEQINKQTQSK